MSPYRLIVAGILGVAIAASAQDSEAVLTLTKDNAEVNSFEVRPNTKQPFRVTVKNVTQQRATFTVELEIPVVGPRGTPQIILREQVTLERDQARVVEFKPPPPPKKEEPPKTPAEAKKEAEAALKPEPPAGLPVPLSDSVFSVKLRVLNDQNRSALKDGQREVRITIQHPLKYVNVPDVKLQGAAARRDLVALITATPVPKDPQKPLEPAADVRFVFPPQLGLKVADLRAGSYQRPLSKTGQQVTLSAENLPYQGAANLPVRYFFNIDGYPRAFTYWSNIRRPIDLVRDVANVEKRDEQSDVRMYPVGTTNKIKLLEAAINSNAVTTPRFATLPSRDLRFRVETDNEGDKSNLQLRIARAGTTLRDFKLLDPDEVIDLGLPKEQRVWLDPAGPDGTLIISNTTTDHVAGVDVSALRGPHEFQAVLREPRGDNPAEFKETRFSYNLVVDDTPPPADDIRIAPFPNRLERGKPLPVFVAASDPETYIERVAVVVGKPGPDGKLPPDAPLFEAERFGLGWRAMVQLPVPPPAPPPAPGAPPVKKEPVPPIDITVLVENEVGLVTARVVRIELVEPLGATLELTILRGGRPQPDTPVTLIDVEGKLKGAGKTDKKGVVVFTNLPPGVYRASAAKEDASYGLAGYLATTIPDPPPPPTKPIKETMELKKRR